MNSLFCHHRRTCIWKVLSISVQQSLPVIQRACSLQGSGMFLHQCNCVGLMLFPMWIHHRESKHRRGNLEPLPAGNGTESTHSSPGYSHLLWLLPHFLMSLLCIRHEQCMLIRPSKDETKMLPCLNILTYLEVILEVRWIEAVGLSQTVMAVSMSRGTTQSP